METCNESWGTSLKAIRYDLDHGPYYCVCVPAGQCVQRMFGVLSEDGLLEDRVCASTIHGVLSWVLKGALLIEVAAGMCAGALGQG